MKIKPSSVKRVLTVVCQKALLSIAEFVLLVTVAAYVSTFIEQTNNSLTKLRRKAPSFRSEI